MAEHPRQHSSGETDLEAHQRTWKGFLALMKWSVIAALAVMALLAIFRAD
ncbi:MAG: aa3-type cytochrome c oxidase subunit IV [Alphaproteobacteria bacterium]